MSREHIQSGPIFGLFRIVGVDIACRMKLSVLDIDPETLTTDHDRYRKALEGGARFGVGCAEVPGVSKDIDEVMAQQQDLVDVLARFDPKVVKMCGDGSRAED